MKQKPVELSLKEVQETGLRILKYVADFCEKNDINYILSDGTLLGAVRHKGFIPWDDDVDISMLREDYEKFIRLWQDTEEYSLLCHENKQDFYLAFTKIVEKNTIVFVNGKRTTNGGLWIDIFPLDATPNSEKERTEHWNKVLKKYDECTVKYFAKSASRFFLEEFLRILRWAVKRRNIKILFASLKKSYESFVIEIQKFNNKDCTNVTNNTVIGYRSEKRKSGYPKTITTDYEYAQFESERFRIPRNYDSMLSCYYGDYMKLPPEDKRCTTHKMSVIKKNHES